MPDTLEQEKPLKTSKKSRRPRPDEEMELMDHLDELRGRLLRSVAYVVVALILAWYWLYDSVSKALTAPMLQVAKEHHLKITFNYFHLTEPFFLQLQVSLFIALALASPFLLWEVWGFIAPGLHPHERRPFKIVFPMAIGLFALGCWLSYAILPPAFAWFLSYLPANVELRQRYPEYLIFVVKMCGAFGLGFELPVVLMFAGKIGLLRDTVMRKYWRQSVVLIMLAAAILTPSNDPLSMMLMATPMAGLYMGSIFLVKWVQPKLAEESSSGADDEAIGSESLHPVPLDVNEED